MLTTTVTEIKKFNGKQWKALLEHCYKYKRGTRSSLILQGLKYPILSNGYLYFTDNIGIVRTYVGVHFADKKTVRLDLSRKILVKDIVKIDEAGVEIDASSGSILYYHWEDIHPSIEKVQFDELFENVEKSFGLNDKERDIYSNSMAFGESIVSKIADMTKAFGGHVNIFPTVPGSDDKKAYLPVLYTRYINSTMLGGINVEATAIYAPYRFKGME